MGVSLGFDSPHHRRNRTNPHPPTHPATCLRATHQATCLWAMTQKNSLFPRSHPEPKHQVLALNVSIVGTSLKRANPPVPSLSGTGWLGAPYALLFRSCSPLCSGGGRPGNLDLRNLNAMENLPDLAVRKPGRGRTDNVNSNGRARPRMLG